MPLKNMPTPEGQLDDPLIGTTIGERFLIEGVLGVGGVGVVYRAQHLSLSLPVALKLLRSDLESVLRPRFEREAKILSQLAHPNIVGLMDYGVDERGAYLVMELLDGEPLDKLLARGPLPVSDAMAIARQILRALAFAHERGVLHRDLKPGNVFLQRLPDNPHHVKLLDFGLAKMLHPEAIEREPTLTHDGTILGTPSYMSPEQASGGASNASSDVYSAGILLYELLTGQLPFVAARRSDLFRAHMTEPLPDPTLARPGLEIDHDLQQLLRDMTQKDIGARIPDGVGALARFDALGEGAAKLHRTDALAATEYPPALTSERSTGSGRSASGSQIAATSHATRWALAAVAMGVALLCAIAWALTREPADPAADATDQGEGSLEHGTLETLLALAGVDEPLEDDIDASSLERETEESPGSDEHGQESHADPGENAAQGDVNAAGGAADAAEDLVPDPMAARMPRELRRLQLRVRRARNLDRNAHKALRIYQRRVPDDPRPSLILAHDFADRGAWPQAAERYRLAVQRNASALSNPTMLRDLIQGSARGNGTRECAAALVELFGERARQPLEQAIEEAETREIAQNLRAILARL